MNAKKEKVYDSDIGNKANMPFAKQLRDLIPDAKTANALKDYLGVSIQAINQYKQGTAFPKTENLIKIAGFFGISVDYLIGFTDIPNRDTNIQAIHGLTGLSAGAIAKLCDMKEANEKTAFVDIVSLLIEDYNAEFFLSLLSTLISSSLEGTDEEYISFDINGIKAVTTVRKAITSLFQTNIIENLPSIVDAYKRQFEFSPKEREKRFDEHGEHKEQ